MRHAGRISEALEDFVKAYLLAGDEFRAIIEWEGKKRFHYEFKRKVAAERIRRKLRSKR